MIRMIFKRIFNRKFSSIFTIIAMTCVFVLIPLGIQYAQQSKLAVEQTIEEHGRGLYDILVRPKDSRTPIEHELGVVEANYIGDSSGGISIKEWEDIKNSEDVEIAAPVASVGYFTGNTNSVGLPLLESPAKIEWTYYTSDGMNNYALDDPFTFYYMDGKEREYFDFIVKPEDLQPDGKMIGFMGAKLPRNYYLLTGIDIESEGKLTGIDYTDLNKYKDIESLLEMDREELDHETTLLIQSLKFRGIPELIPVIQRSDLNLSLYFELNVENLSLSLPEFKGKYNLDSHENLMSLYNENDDEMINQMIDELNVTPVLSKEEHLIDLSEYQSPFNGNYVEITNEYTVKWGEGGSLTNDTSLYYTASKVDYQINGKGVNVPIIEDGSPPSYKRVEQKGESYFEAENFEVPFMLWQTGTFSPQKDEGQLVSSPLGIYTTKEVRTKDGTELTPTTKPGSFISQPAAGVTTIEAAEFIKGDKPIDAIRLKVADIDSYNQEAQEKINQVAIDLLEEGYEVDIVAGSSFQQVEMNVEGIGQVTAPWTTLGTAQSLVDGWNYLAVVSIILFAVFGIIWYISKLFYEKNQFAEENDILSKLGWSKNKIKLRNFLEQLTLVTVAFLISIGLLMILVEQINQSHVLSLIGLWAILSLLILAVFNYNSKPSIRVEPYRFIPSLLHYRHLILPVICILIISTILIVIQMTSLVSTFIEARQTTLGTFAMDTVQTMQLLILLATFGIAIISISESFKALMLERKNELTMYHVVGWSKKMIQKHIRNELTLWAGFAYMIGGSISCAVLLYLDFSLSWIIMSVATVFLLFVVLFMLLIKTSKSYLNI
ncbi:hypothetical protein ACFFJI_11120 [Allobacillus sp. GCM10007491]|uniref:ABC transporter permease n=1 Tax=Allobacillus saliphilus TaxID=2912308 RepID=A0A941CW07_9BACI|nr:hypothetical protein [Allobacillus saliphilus]MBR7554704.1 hypothetical protein [Allobacillus saliphilus]